MSAVRTTNTVGKALPALLGAVVVSIVLGIVGMHALNTHGVMNSADHALMTGHGTDPVAGQPGGSPSHMHRTVGGGAGIALPAGTASAAPMGGNGHGIGQMMMLCVAMLAAAAGALLLLLAGLRRMNRMWAHLPTTPTALAQRVASRLATGPPAVWQFSVIRC